MNRPYQKIASEYDKIAVGFTNFKFKTDHRLPKLAQFASLLTPNGKVLDLGCGGGQDTQFLESKGFQTTGIDISKVMIDEAKKRVPNATFMVGNFLEIDFSDKRFDGVWCSNVFHHITPTDQDDFLTKIHNLLSKDGLLYISMKRLSQGDMKEEIDSSVWTEADNIKTELYKVSMQDDVFKKMVETHGFTIVDFNIWKNQKWSEIIAKKFNPPAPNKRVYSSMS